MTAAADNAVHAGLARLALDAYAEMIGAGPDRPRADVILGLLADLMHYADVEGLDFRAIVERADTQHADEAAWAHEEAVEAARRN